MRPAATTLLLLSQSLMLFAVTTLRLTKDKRVNFVKTDFARWADQDEQEGAAVDEGFGGADQDMGMGGMGGMGGMPGMGGMGGMGGGPGGTPL